MPRRRNRTNVFYAYPNLPASIGECVKDAIDSLSEKRSLNSAGLRFIPWTEMNTGGKSLIASVTGDIGRSSIFACDLTYPNFNVTFELGYAIGKFKRVWISLNDAIESASADYKRVFYNMLGGLAYSSYTNNINLAEAFESDRPWTDLDETPIGESLRRRRFPREDRTLFYVRPGLDTNAVVKCMEAIDDSPFKYSVIADNPKEDPSPTLEWYATQAYTADAVLVQLLSENEKDHFANNLRGAFVSGLAHGLGKPLFLIAPSPFEPPADYQTLLRVHETAEECRSSVSSWLSNQSPPASRRRRQAFSTQRGSPRKLDLRTLSVGEHVAENERWGLDPYFVETNSFRNAIEGPTRILVGRRGTGKTANLYGIQGALEGPNNHVCTIKPVAYEIDGLVRVLNENMDRAERGYLIESLWKFLIFSELALSVRNEIESKPVYLERTQGELSLLQFMDQRGGSFLSSFTERIDKAVTDLIGIGEVRSSSQQRVRISELLHTGDIVRLREYLGVVLADRHKVAILIDNLDESWTPNHDIDRLSELLLGLLRVASDLSNELHQQDHRRRAVNSAVTVFLRSDIFALIQPQTAEQDKLPVERLYWDKDSLLKVLEYRFMYASPGTADCKAIWDQFFPKEIVGLPIADFITGTVLPRPRDIIFLVSSAIGLAINRGSEVVAQNDLLQARDRYSDFILKSVLAEDDPRKGMLESVLYEFAGAPKTLGPRNLALRLKNAGVKDSDLEFYVDLLCDINFLGILTARGEFRYSKDENERRNLREIARRLPVQNGDENEIYQITDAFHVVLQIN